MAQPARTRQGKFQKNLFNCKHLKYLFAEIEEHAENLKAKNADRLNEDKEGRFDPQKAHMDSYIYGDGQIFVEIDWLIVVNDNAYGDDDEDEEDFHRQPANDYEIYKKGINKYQ